MSPEEVVRIIDAHDEEFARSKAENCFLEGLLILNRLHNSDQSYAAEHDIFYANTLEEMPGITEENVIELNRLGWHFNRQYNCFAHFI